MYRNERRQDVRKRELKGSHERIEMKEGKKFPAFPPY
jgi:hypothetical protein